MEIQDKIAVVTGAASGIGKALCLALHAAGAQKVVCADLNGEGAADTARQIDGAAYEVDVSTESDIRELIEVTEDQHGPIDLFVSNAGIIDRGGLEIPNENWQKIWDVSKIPLPFTDMAMPFTNDIRSFHESWMNFSVLSNNFKPCPIFFVRMKPGLKNKWLLRVKRTSLKLGIGATMRKKFAAKNLISTKAKSSHTFSSRILFLRHLRLHHACLAYPSSRSMD